MFRRLGNVLYWLACAGAAGLLTWAALNAAVLLGIFGAWRADEDAAAQIIMSCLAAIGAWLFGRSCRYLLGGA